MSARCAQHIMQSYAVTVSFFIEQEMFALS